MPVKSVSAVGRDVQKEALKRTPEAAHHRKSMAVLSIAVLGGVYGDGGAMITPAISLLSAVEGLERATPAMNSYVILITLGKMAMAAGLRVGI